MPTRRRRLRAGEKPRIRRDLSRIKTYSVMETAFWKLKRVRLSWLGAGLWAMIFVVFSASGAALEKPRVPVIDARADFTETVTDRVAYFPEPGEALDLAEAAALVTADPARLQRSEASVLALGIDAAPVWLVADVENPTDEPIQRRLALRTAWLNRVDFHFISTGTPPQHSLAGDLMPVGERTVDSRLPSADYDFPPGMTRVFIRVETADPMVLPLHFSSVSGSLAREQLATVFYSFVYGVMFALMAYNLMLFFGLRRRRYLFYTFYMGCFVGMTLAYSGIGMRLFWPDAVSWQQWAPPLFMLLFASAGLIFAADFLGLRYHRPRLLKATVTLCLAYSAIFAGLLLANEQGWTLKLMFTLVPIFSGLMLYFGASSWFGGNRAARYFLLGVLASVLGASVTASAVAGLIPYNRLTYHAVDIGMVVDAILLALALTDLFRQNQQARLVAERKAAIDPLTRLNNRRGFLPVAESMWSLAQRNDRDICVALIDVDHFKEVNDRYGHSLGDVVLARIAEVLDQSRRTGDILARWGGEEFILLLPETTVEEAGKVAERIRADVETLVAGDRGRKIQRTISIGVAPRERDAESLEQVIVAADRALYRAKSRGRNQVACAGEPEFPGELVSA